MLLHDLPDADAVFKSGWCPVLKGRRVTVGEESLEPRKDVANSISQARFELQLVELADCCRKDNHDDVVLSRDLPPWKDHERLELNKSVRIGHQKQGHGPAG